VIEGDVLLAEALLDTVVLGAVTVEMVDPEVQRIRRHTIDHTLDLSSAPASLPADLPVGERGRDRTRRSDLVGVVEVVDGVGAVEEHRLLDHPLPDDLSVEVYVFLRAARARRQVVKPADQIQLVLAQLSFS
jgi:hypothetical protein